MNTFYSKLFYIFIDFVLYVCYDTRSVFNKVLISHIFVSHYSIGLHLYAFFVY